MEHTLVGYTGFVGGNLAAQHRFTHLYNSKNIGEAFGADNGLVVYSGMPSEKFLANADPAADYARAAEAMENIRRMRPERLVLVSTVDVYKDPRGVYEDTPAGGDGMPAYGQNRLALEEMVHDTYPEALVVRLPGLYGVGIKKNFVFDMLHPVPSTLTEEKYGALLQGAPLVREAYAPDGRGFYRLGALDARQETALAAQLTACGFSALHFTDSRSAFQFYPLSRLWEDIARCLAANLTLVNLAVAPVTAGALYEAIYQKPFENHLPKPPADYDMRTRHAALLGGAGDYLQSAAQVVAGVRRFVKGGNP